MRNAEKNHLKKIAHARSRKITRLLASAGKTNQEIADGFKMNEKPFLQSDEWKALRKLVILKFGHQCMKCGRTPKDKSKVNVDHIKPRKFFPDLSLSFENLQVLCSTCNKNKGNKNQIDYRNKTLAEKI